jgi:hypothetical protein
MAGMDEQALVTPLYAALAISPIWLLLGKVSAVRKGSRRVPLIGLVEVN